MSRQDSNAAFARSSFLYGGNAGYIEELQARYEAKPQSVDAEWQAYFESLNENAADVVKNARGPSWQRSDWPPQMRGELISALDGDWRGAERAVGDKVKAKAQAKGVASRRPRCSRPRRLHPRADADPRLSGARALPRQSGPARA